MRYLQRVGLDPASLHPRVRRPSASWSPLARRGARAGKLDRRLDANLVVVCNYITYVISRLVALPGFEHAVGRWPGPLGILSLVVEALFIAVFLLAVTTRRG